MDATKIVVFKSILVARAKLGATLAEIRGDYADNEGERITISDSSLITSLLSIPDITSQIISGEKRFFCNSKNTAHIVKLVERQRIPDKSNSFRSPYNRPYLRGNNVRTPNNNRGNNSQNYKEMLNNYQENRQGGENRRPVNNSRFNEGNAQQNQGGENRRPVNNSRFNEGNAQRNQVDENQRPGNNSRSNAENLHENKNRPAPATARPVVVTNHMPDNWDDLFVERAADNTPVVPVETVRNKSPVIQNVQSPAETGREESHRLYKNTLLKVRRKTPSHENMEIDSPTLEPVLEQTIKHYNSFWRDRNLPDLSPLESVVGILNKNSTVKSTNEASTSTFTAMNWRAVEETQPQESRGFKGYCRDPRFRDSNASQSISVPLISPPIEDRGTVPPPTLEYIKTEPVNLEDDTAMQKRIAEYSDGISQLSKRTKPNEQSPNPVENFLTYQRSRIVVRREGKPNQCIIITDGPDPRQNGRLKKMNYKQCPLELQTIPPYACTDLVIYGLSKTPITQTAVDVFGGWKYNSFLYNHELIGDDFFLAILKEERGHVYIPDAPRLRIGSCVARQTIREAYRLMEPRTFKNKNVVINLGTIDLLEGRSANKMIDDFKDLMAMLRIKGVKDPKVATLPPIGNKNVDKNIRDELKKFNRFLKSHTFIDLHGRMVDEDEGIRRRFYEHRHSYHSQEIKPVLWSELGRKRVLDTLTNRLRDTEDVSDDDCFDHISLSSSTEDEEHVPRQTRPDPSIYRRRRRQRSPKSIVHTTHQTINYNMGTNAKANSRNIVYHQSTVCKW